MARSNNNKSLGAENEALAVGVVVVDRAGRVLELLFVGNDWLRKGLPYLVEAVHALPRGSVRLGKDCNHVMVVVDEGRQGGHGKLRCARKDDPHQMTCLR